MPGGGYSGPIYTMLFGVGAIRRVGCEISYMYEISLSAHTNN